MISSRQSVAAEPNPGLKPESREQAESNAGWLERVLGDKKPEGWICLFGGANLTDFRLRVAQSHVRNDLLPSFWSHVAIVESAKSDSPMEWKLDEVRLDPLEGFGNVAANNGVQQSSFRRYDDPGLFPNIGIVNFHVDAELIKESKDKFRSQRNLIDVPGLMVDWLAYAWGVADRGNPLLKAVGIPRQSSPQGSRNIVRRLSRASLQLPGWISPQGCPPGQVARRQSGRLQSGGTGFTPLRRASQRGRRKAVTP